jgi:hypothetical protein
MTRLERSRIALRQFVVVPLLQFYQYPPAWRRVTSRVPWPMRIAILVRGRIEVEAISGEFE